MFIIATFYHFFDFADFKERRQSLIAELTRLGIKGSLLIAPEGINATLAGTREAIDECLSYLQTEITHAPITHKESLCDAQPFKRTKVRLKKETISLGVPVCHPALVAGSPSISGRPRNGCGVTANYVEPKDWNALIADPDTILIDSRNSYEVHLGTFDGAIDPNIRTFKQLPEFIRHKLADKKHKKIATFCTGGIRCEKLAAWMLEEGFEQVYQLNGGILKYLEEIPAEQSKWHGECFVFDERVAVGHGLVPSRDAKEKSQAYEQALREDKK